MKNKAQAFTFVEILIAVICVGVIVSMGGLSFKKAREAHRVDTFVQELLLLRSAFLGYYEMHQSMPQAATPAPLGIRGHLDVLKPFWYPFNPNNSQVIPGASWYGNSSSSDLNSVCLFLMDKKGYVTFTENQIQAIRNKVDQAFTVNTSGTPPCAILCYIFKKP